MSENCGVYLIVSPSNKRYVGSSCNLKKRFNRYKNLSCKRQRALYSSFIKYGVENHTFKILINCDKPDLYFWERVFGDIYLALADFKNGLNIVLPSYGDTPRAITEKFRKQVSITQIERFKDPLERKKTSESTKKGFTESVRHNMSILHKIRCNTEEFKKNKSISQTNYFKSEEVRSNLSNSIKKYYINNPEMKKKQMDGLNKFYTDNPNIRSERMKQSFIDNPNKGKIQSIRIKEMYNNNPEKRQMASIKTKEQLNKNGHPMSKMVIHNEYGIIYNTLKEASKSAGYSETTFRRIIKGEHKIKLQYSYL